MVKSKKNLPRADDHFESLRDEVENNSSEGSVDGGAKESLIASLLEEVQNIELETPDSGDKTTALANPLDILPDVLESSPATGDETLAVDGFANVQPLPKPKEVLRAGRGASSVLTSIDASLAQAENLKLAQHRILELEQENEKLRSENEELSSAADFIKNRADELNLRVSDLAHEKQEAQDSAQSEILVLKGSLQFKDGEFAKARLRIEELESRLKSDFKKIRVRERELENRLELLRAEKSALVRAKDDYILEQKRKIDQISQELENYRDKCLELNKVIGAHQEQVKRTERALRLALTNLEAQEENVVPLKKAK